MLRSRDFVDTVDRVNGIQNPVLRSNALGAFQAEIGIWQILARQRQIPEDSLNASWQDAIQPYAGVASIRRSSSMRRANRSSRSWWPRAARRIRRRIRSSICWRARRRAILRRCAVHEEMARKMRAVLDDQRLVSLDTLFGLYDGLGEMAHGRRDWRQPAAAGRNFARVRDAAAHLHRGRARVLVADGLRQPPRGAAGAHRPDQGDQDSGNAGAAGSGARASWLRSCETRWWD